MTATLFIVLSVLLSLVSVIAVISCTKQIGQDIDILNKRTDDLNDRANTEEKHFHKHLKELQDSAFNADKQMMVLIRGLADDLGYSIEIEEQKTNSDIDISDILKNSSIPDSVKKILKQGNIIAPFIMETEPVMVLKKKVDIKKIKLKKK